MKTLLAVLLVALAAACDPYPFTFEAPRDSGADVLAEPVPAVASILADCAVSKVYAVGTCGVYQDGDTLRSCSASCTQVDDGAPIGNCLTTGQHHFVREAHNTTTNPRTWNDPDETLLGPIACFATAADCAQSCH